MGEVNVTNALDRITASSAKSQTEGLNDLKHILSHNRRSAKVETLDGESWHHIYETLFRFITSEKSTYLKTTAPIRKNTSTTRLALGAGVLRLVVEVHVRRLRTRTLKALCDHILQTLPTATGKFCEPLSLDYTRCLRTVLEYQPHVEHLSRQDWKAIVDFCLEAISSLCGRTATDSTHDGNESPASGTPDASARTSRSGTREPTGREKRGSHSSGLLEDLIGCVRQLTRAPSAPILDSPQQLLATLIAFLKSSKTVGGVQQDAFAAINAVLARTSYESVKTTQDAIQQLVPVVKDMWSTKLVSVKDEMLITLIHGKSHIAALLRQSSSALFRRDIENLLEAMETEYVRRQENKDLLQLDDLRLEAEYSRNSGQIGLGTAAFSLRSGTAHAESNSRAEGGFRKESHWMIVYFIAFFATLLDGERIEFEHQWAATDYASKKKKPRLSHFLGDYFRQLSDSRLSFRICALQFITFAVHLAPLDEEGIQNVLDKLITHIGDGNGKISSWTVLALANCAFQKSASIPSVANAWMNIWQMAVKAIPTASSCRAACHLVDVLLRLKVVNYASVAEHLDAMISSSELNGPAVLAESSAAVWETIILIRVSQNPGLFDATAKRALHWLFSKWSPSSFGDRLYIQQNSQHCEPVDILRILFACTSRALLRDTEPRSVVLGSLAQAWSYCSHYAGLLDYLLLSVSRPSFQRSIEDHPGDSQSLSSKAGQRSLAQDILIVDYCAAEAERTRQNWHEWSAERPQNISADMIRTVVGLCIVSSFVSNSSDSRTVRRCEELKRVTDSLIETVTAFASRQDCVQQSVDAMLEIVAHCLPDVRQVEFLDQEQLAKTGVSSFVLYLSKSLDHRRKLLESLGNAVDEDFMDVNDGFGSQHSHEPSQRETCKVPRHVWVAQSDVVSLRSSVSTHVKLLSTAFEPTGGNGGSSTVPSAFIEHLLSLPAADILACRPFLAALLSSPLHLNAEDAECLLETIGTSFLSTYDYERCELAITLSLDIMAGTLPLWSNQKQGALCEIGRDLYEWFVDTALKAGISSPNVQIAMARIFQGLLKHNPDYAQTLSLPSVRTSLFSLLQDGDIIVKYRIAQDLSEVFRLFVLAKHDAIFDDVNNSLPRDFDWPEGIALRLLVFCRLGSQWHTLLRRCVYHTFEAAGLLEDCANHATYCITEISEALRLESPQALFRLFAQQLLYTWLDASQSVARIPYHIFGYTTLSALLTDSEEEAVAQIVIRGKDTDIEAFTNSTKTPIDIILQRRFGKAAAYSISWDTCYGAARDKGTPSCEARLRTQVGQDKYHRLIQKWFPCILGIILASLEQEDQIEKAFARRTTFDYAARNLKEMQDISCSTSPLPVNQQPSFNSKFLLEQIERVCRRTAYDPVSFWTPEVYVYVLQMLLDRIHPALGSLHACSIIRKVRILVSLAGKVPLSGYPLQLSLRSLRPFITDSQCADDTLGVVQYLLNHGRSSLVADIPFLSGIAVSSLISLRAFLSSSQDSTTQETQHLATLGKAQAFHGWLAKYITSLEPAQPNGVNGEGREHSSSGSFLSIVQGACNVRAQGNAFRGSAESQLLLELLEDEKSDRRFLNESAHELALNLLCRDFELPQSYREDVLGIDDVAAELAIQVWNSCQRAGASKNYLLWAARVLGRAHSAHGNLQHALQNAIASSITRTRITGSVAGSSVTSIIQIVAGYLLSDVPLEARLAENALRSMLSKSESAELIAEIEQVLSRDVVSALSMPDPHEFHPPTPSELTLEQAAKYQTSIDYKSWVRQLTVSLLRSAAHDTVIGSLPDMVSGIAGLAERLFPHILHIVLTQELDGEQNVRRVISEVCHEWFSHVDTATAPFVRVLLNAILYLRTQPLPRETTRADRERWLDLNYLEAAHAAAGCGMYTASLLFAEIYVSPPVRTSKRASTAFVQPSLPTELQLSIYKNIDEPDSYYGVRQPPTLSTVLDRFDYEADGFKGLLFRSARLDSQTRRLDQALPADSQGLVNSLTMLNLNSLTHSLLTQERPGDTGSDMANSLLHAARKLEQWDLKAPETNRAESATIFRAFQGLSISADLSSTRDYLDRSFLEAFSRMKDPNINAQSMRSALRTLAVLAETDDVMSSRGADDLQETWQRLRSREHWMHTGRYEDVGTILSCRETLFSLLSGSSQLQNAMHASPKELRAIEVDSLLLSSSLARKHGALQESLASATYLADLVPDCAKVGLNVEAAAQYEAAKVLWDQGELTTSIGILQQLNADLDSKEQASAVGRSSLLAMLGHHMAEARMKKPDEITKDYLMPAIGQLKGQTQGKEAGQVFHEFASFCDKQLQSPEGLEDLARMQKMRDKKEVEAREYEKASKSAKTPRDKEQCRQAYKKAKKWLEIDSEEFQKMRANREDALRQSLENYLLSLQASDDHENDVLRVFSLWLEYSEQPLANAAVSKHIGQVPSRKFVILMNQLSSRLQAEKSDFQSLLARLVLRVCIEHPYHGMHQIYAGAMPLAAKDDASRSRNAAAKDISRHLRSDKRAHRYWTIIHESNTCYHEVAMIKDDNIKLGRSVKLDDFGASKKMAQKVPSLKVPPATMHIPIRADCDYSTIPRITAFKPTMTIANGLSAPKIVTVAASDGQTYKQLYKSGNDDLRQDAIMEQVFEQVSRLLKNHTATRQRDLHIRTYKVLPLSARTGIIEFVQNTIALHSYLIPAHEKYYPRDWKASKCRESIADAAQHSNETRIKAFKTVMANFTPVMRYFFLERFEDPDDWFAKRLAYVRSTAAISILGHVLGLGDRHCHNILLDEKTGEVVHIDLGVAFEAGRVLPVPEVVPFRLTRDLVDGMGYMGTEGVFRRCCEFTLETLREERESIMTLLNVLRYDPLYNWTVSWTKAKRMQQGEEAENAPPVDEIVDHSSKKEEEEAGEAGRALSVVERKLSKTLSAQATVSELIQQATDERNLALLYSGWAAYV